MKFPSLVLQLSVWVTIANAFHIWEPCRVDESCEKEEGKAVEGRDASGDLKTSKPLTLSIHQRLRPAEHPSRGVSGDANRLSKKYAKNRASGGPAWADRGRNDKRENRYTVMVPAEPQHDDAVGIFQDGKDYAYFVQAEIGSKKQPMYMLLDTGAGSTWVMGSDCTTEPCKLHDTFDPSTSNTFEDKGKNFSVKYGSGSVSGIIGEDKIRVGDVEVSLEMGLADNTSNDFKHFPFDGILGMAMTVSKTANFPAALSAGGKMESNVFSVYLGRGTSGQNEGELTLGGINEDRVAGDISYTVVPKDRKGDWAIPLDEVGVASGKTLGTKGRLALIDTGTSFIFASPEAVGALHKLIPGATRKDEINWEVPCDTNESVTFTFSGKAYKVLAQDWIQKQAKAGMCKSNIYGKEVVKDGWLLGAAYLKNVYAVFDMDERRIGFSQRNDDVPEYPLPPAGSDPPPAPGTSTEDPPPMGVGGPQSSRATGEPSSTGDPESTGESKDSPKQGASAKSLPRGLVALAVTILAAAHLY